MVSGLMNASGDRSRREAHRKENRWVMRLLGILPTDGQLGNGGAGNGEAVPNRAPHPMLPNAVVGFEVEGVAIAANRNTTCVAADGRSLGTTLVQPTTPAPSQPWSANCPGFTSWFALLLCTRNRRNACLLGLLHRSGLTLGMRFRYPVITRCGQFPTSCHCNRNGSCAPKSDGTAACWGRNYLSAFRHERDICPIWMPAITQSQAPVITGLTTHRPFPGGPNRTCTRWQWPAGAPMDMASWASEPCEDQIHSGRGHRFVHSIHRARDQRARIEGQWQVGNCWASLTPRRPWPWPAELLRDAPGPYAMGRSLSSRMASADPTIHPPYGGGNGPGGGSRSQRYSAVIGAALENTFTADVPRRQRVEITKLTANSRVVLGKKVYCASVVASHPG